METFIQEKVEYQRNSELRSMKLSPTGMNWLIQVWQVIHGRNNTKLNGNRTKKFTRRIIGTNLERNEGVCLARRYALVERKENKGNMHHKGSTRFENHFIFRHSLQTGQNINFPLEMDGYL